MCVCVVVLEVAWEYGSGGVSRTIGQIAGRTVFAVVAVTAVARSWSRVLAQLDEVECGGGLVSRAAVVPSVGRRSNLVVVGRCVALTRRRDVAALKAS